MLVPPRSRVLVPPLLTAEVQLAKCWQHRARVQAALAQALLDGAPLRIHRARSMLLRLEHEQRRLARLLAGPPVGTAGPRP